MPDVGDHPAIPEPVEATPLPAFDYDALEKGEQIGTGGDANVYEASLSVDGETHRLALKEPRFEGTVRTEIFDRFEEEAETWANLDDHKNIVTVHGYGAGSVPWIALEYMDGGTLTDKVEDIDFEEALWLAGRIAEGVRHGHRHGIAHLDLKPSNVLIRETPDGKWNYPKVSDWGLAKMLLEHSKSIEGLSPTYAAPEQFNADEYGRPDDVTDVYQLGTIIYELLTGQPPFTGAATDVMQSVLHETPPTPSEINPDLPTEVDDVLLKALSKEKEDRYEGVLILRRKLDELFYNHATEQDVDVDITEQEPQTTSIQDDQSGDDTPQQSETQATGAKSLKRRSAVTLLIAGIGGGGVLGATQIGFLPSSGGGGGNKTNGTDGGTSPDPGGGEIYEVERFEYVNSFESDGRLVDDNIKVQTISGERIDIPGNWAGDSDILSDQAYAARSFDILEGDSTVSSTDIKLIPWGYEFVMEQTPDNIYITYQPSVADHWEFRMTLGTQQNPKAIAPAEIMSNEKVFKIKKSDFNVESGQYDWFLNINPRSGVSSFEFPVKIGRLNGSSISIGFDDPDAYPSSEEAITSAASVANESAIEVELPDGSNEGSLELDGGHRGGTVYDSEAYFIGRGIKVICDGYCEFGPGIDRKFRINNSTTDKEFIFTPE